MDELEGLPGLSPLSLRSLSSVSRLHTGACCPTMDLVALPSSTEAKLSLWRMSGTVAKAWERQTEGQADDLCWSPDAVNERIVLHSLHHGNPLPIHVALDRSVKKQASDAENEPPKKRRKVDCLSWSSFERSKDARPHFSSSGQILERLPQLTAPAKDSKQASGAFSATSALAPLGSGAGAAKSTIEIARSNFSIMAAGVPCLPPPVSMASAAEQSAIRSSSEPRRTADSRDSILLASIRGSARVEVLLAGTVSLGSIDLPSDAVALASDVLHRDQDHSDEPLLIGVLYSIDGQLHHRLYSLADFPSAPLERLYRTSSTIFGLLAHAIVGLEDARKAWTDAQASWQSWLEKLAPESISSKPERLKEARAMLMHLLVTGRASAEMREYFTSKNNERAFAKVEQGMSQALGQLGMLSMHHLGPVVERVIMKLEEMLGWALWPEKMGQLKLDPAVIRRSLALATDLYRRVIDFDTAVRNEWQTWPDVRKWIRVELERAAALATSAAAQLNMTPAQRARDREREKAAKPHPVFFAHDAMIVARFLQDHGANAAAIGGALALDMSAVRSAWDTELPAEPESTASKPPTLQEVRAAIDGTGPKLQKPTPGTRPVGDSLALLYAELSRTIGIALGSPLTRTAKAAQLVSSHALYIAGRGEVKARSRAMTDGSQMLAVMAEGGHLQLIHCPADGEKPKSVAFTTSMNIADFSFFDDAELVLVISRGSTFRLATLSLEKLSTSTLTWRRAHQLGGAAEPPQACALNGRAGRRVGCVLGADGRTLEVLDMEDAGDGEDDEVDADAADVDAQAPAQERSPGAEEEDETMEDVDENMLVDD